MICTKLDFHPFAKISAVSKCTFLMYVFSNMMFIQDVECPKQNSI